MVTKALSGAPTPQTDAERLLVEQLGKEGGIRPEFLKELVKGLCETREAASVVMAAVDREPEKRLSFAKAAEFLGESPFMIGGFECKGLEAARTEVAKAHGRWNLVNTLVERGTIEDASKYVQLFDKATVSEQDLQKVKEAIERGEKMLALFDAGDMMPDKLCKALFEKAGIPYMKGTYALKDLGKIRRIDPRDVPNLQGLDKHPSREQNAAFQAAYKKAKPFEPTGPRIIFTPDKREVIHANTSAIQEAQAVSKGDIKFLDFAANMLRFRTQMDAGLRRLAGRQGGFDEMTPEVFKEFLVKSFQEKTINPYMPDSENVSRDPLSVFENGQVPGLSFQTAYHRGVVVSYHHPDAARAGLGSRISLG